MPDYAATVLSKKPGGYWRLGEKSGSKNALDTSGNGHIGTYHCSTPHEDTAIGESFQATCE
jgi:hypothetical protein